VDSKGKRKSYLGSAKVELDAERGGKSGKDQTEEFEKKLSCF